MSQFTTVTGTVRDPTGRIYQDGSFSVNFVDPGTSGRLATLSNGQPFQTSFSGSLDSFGFFSVTVADSAQIASASGEANTQWQFVIAASANILQLPAGVPVPSFSYTTAINCASNIPGVCVSGTIDISAQLQAVAAFLPPSAGGVIPFVGPPTGPCTATQVAVDTTTGNFYSCNGGVWQKVGPGGGALSSPITAPNPLAFDVELHFKGPDPYVDITRYGARSVALGTAPAIPGITANCTSTLATVTLSTASTFQNGDGVVLFGCGAPHSMTTPGAPTVTPSVASAGTGTSFVVNGTTGSTTYNYQIIARDKNGGLTAASTVGSTTTGLVSLGAQSVNISTLSKSGQVNTVTTSSSHGLTTGSMVIIGGTTDDPDFGGWQVVTGSADNTHFTYANGLDSANGAGTSATGGTVQWWNCNHLSWTAVTGAFEYYIYGRTGGSLTLLGVSKPSNAPQFGFNWTGMLTWDDFGSPMMDGFSAPYFVPTTPPGAATSDSLVTTISSGAGTTSLTLANAAGTTISGQTILFTNGPALVAAANASLSGGGMVYTPTGSWVINSYTQIPGSTAISFAGTLFLNDTIESATGTKFYGNLTPQSSANPPSFGFEGYTGFDVAKANPGVYAPNGNQISFHGIGFSSGVASSNNQLHLLIDEATNATLDRMNFSGNGSSDYMSIGVMFRAFGENTSFFNYFDNIAFIPPSVGGSATPYLFCDYGGLNQLKNISVNKRGLMFGSIGDLTVEGGRMQGGDMPFLIVGGSPSQAGFGGTVGIVTVRNYELDTSGVPLIANLTLLPGPSLVDNSFITIDNAGIPSSSIPNYTGAASGRLLSTQFGQPGQSTHALALDGNGILASGTATHISVSGGADMGYLLSRPLAPTVVVGAHGSCVSNCVVAGTYYYAISPADTNGNYGAFSPIASAATTDGTQTMTISWTSVPGQVLTYLSRFTSPSYLWRGDSGGVGVTGNSYVDTNSFSYSCSVPCSPTGNRPAFGVSSGMNSAGLTTPQLVLSGSGFTSTLSGVFTANRTITAPDSNSVLIGSSTFANLGTPANGTFTYCSDCTIANPCAGGGTGALAKRLNGVWVCN